MSDTILFPSVGRSNYRIPSIVVTNQGTVLAFVNDRRDTLLDHAQVSWVVMRRKEMGGTWEQPVILAQYPDWSCRIESAVYDRQTDQTILFFTRIAVSVNEFGDYTKEDRERMTREAEERAAEAGLSLGFCMLVSSDDGKTWQERPFICTPNSKGFIGFTHGASPGIQLQYGQYAGRLLCPARYMSGHYTTIDELQQYGFNNALYSDDHGQTWTSSEPVQSGTGEGTLVELSDGTILFNSRAYYHDQKRYLATGHDGGASFSDFRTDDFLLEEKFCGCNACMIRISRDQLKHADLLSKSVRSVLLFSNPRSERRMNMTVCISMDEGKTWRTAKNIRESYAAYSAMAYSQQEGLVYLLYELGNSNPHDLGLSITAFRPEELLG